MKATFLVELDLGSSLDLVGIAADLEEHLYTFDYPTLSVKPWQRHDPATGGATLPQTAEPSNE